jgi:hypothetical protein
MKRTVITAGQADGAAAILTFQRPPSVRLGYPLRHRAADWWRGRRDRHLIGGLEVSNGALEVDTVYLQYLGRACAGHLEPEYLQTTAMFSVLDAKLAAAGAELRRALDDADRLAGREPDRRQAELDGEQAARLRLERDRAEAGRAAGRARAEVERLHIERIAHWHALQRRAAEILAQFDLRAATYAGAATRGVSGPIAPVRVSRPSWLGPDVPGPRPEGSRT